MRKLGFIPLACSLLAAPATLSQADRTEGVAHLERTRAALVAATKGLSDAQWKFKPAPDRWSVAECVEHIALAEDMLFENVTKKVMQASAGKEDRDYKAIDKIVVTAIADRSQKAQAPEPLVPAGRRSPQESLTAFLKSRQHTIDYLKSAEGLRDHVVESPIRQPLDAYQWLLFISAHTERHTKQLLEVKADPNFPRK